MARWSVEQKKQAIAGNSFPVKALIVGALLSILVAMYSAFAGLKIGGVYWPSITGAIFSMAILSMLGKHSKHDVNISQTAASAGGLLAGGLIFTIPAIWMLGLKISLWELFFVSIIGGLAGIIFSVPLRKEMVEKEKLPFPEGTATAAVIEAGDEGGKKAKAVFGMLGIGAIFSLLRDWFAVIPGLLSIDSLQNGISRIFSLGTSVSLIPFAGGYLIGPRFTGIWFLGAILSNFILIPYFVFSGAFASKGEAYSSIAAPLGIGIVVGAAIAYFILKALPRIGKMVSDYKGMRSGNAKIYGVILIVLIGLLSITLQLDPLVSILAILGAFIMAYVGARVTGEMNIDPMELFAMIVMIAAKLLFGFNAFSLILLAAVICISAGIAGDMMQDLKTGYLIGTKPRHQIMAQIAGVISASIVLGIVLFALNSSYGIGSAELPAPQAVALSAVVSAESISFVLAIGIAIGFIAVFALNFFTSPIAAVAFGIGVYVPISLSLPLFIGGLLRLFAERKKVAEKCRLLAAGAIAGEGIVGVLLALYLFIMSVIL